MASKAVLIAPPMAALLVFELDLSKMFICSPMLLLIFGCQIKDDYTAVCHTFANVDKSRIDSETNMHWEYKRLP